MSDIFLTGVSSGIGHALAEYYLSHVDAGTSPNVYGVSRRTPDVLMEHERFHFASVDLTAGGAITDQIRQLLSDVRQVDLAILNAGILGPFGDLAQQDVAEMKTVMEVNVWANKYILDALYADERIVRQVVTISSGAAVNGNRGWGGYAISKAALNMFTALAAAEHPGTHFTALAPGVVDTYMQDVLCGRDSDERFPSIDALKGKRGTEDMPNPETAARQLATAIERLPELVESGKFADIRKEPLASL